MPYSHRLGETMNATPYIEALGKETGMDITLSASGAAALSEGGTY